MPKTDRAWRRVSRQAKTTFDDDTQPDFYNIMPDDNSEALDASFTSLHIIDPLLVAMTFDMR
jgi:hypothetical protein